MSAGCDIPLPCHMPSYVGIFIYPLGVLHILSFCDSIYTYSASNESFSFFIFYMPLGMSPCMYLIYSSFIEICLPLANHIYEILNVFWLYYFGLFATNRVKISLLSNKHSSFFFVYEHKFCSVKISSWKSWFKAMNLLWVWSQIYGIEILLVILAYDWLRNKTPAVSVHTMVDWDKTEGVEFKV